MEKLRSLISDPVSLPLDQPGELSNITSIVQKLTKDSASKRAPKTRAKHLSAGPSPSTRKSIQPTGATRGRQIPIKSPPFFLQLEGKTETWFLRADRFIALYSSKSCSMIDTFNSVSIEQKTLIVNETKMNIKGDKEAIMDLVFTHTRTKSSVKAFFICAKACDGIPPCNNLTYGFYVSTIMNAEFLCACAFLNSGQGAAAIDWERYCLVVRPYLAEVLEFTFAHANYLGSDGMIRKDSFLGILADKMFAQDQLWKKFREFVQESEHPMKTFLTRLHRGVMEQRTRLMLYKCYAAQNEDPVRMLVKFVWEIGLRRMNAECRKQLKAIACDGTPENRLFRKVLMQFGVFSDEIPEFSMDIHTRVDWMNAINHTVPQQLALLYEAANEYDLCLRKQIPSPSCVV